ncbi:MAG: hypothetical protein H8D35_07480 [Nitrosopumilus sp.]|nr:hypothetical protein [Nitrosopumilus sp.]
MSENHIREALGQRLEVADVEYDIKRMSAEMNYHMSKAKIFEQTIKSRQGDLDEMLGAPQNPVKNGEMYK